MEEEKPAEEETPAAETPANVMHPTAEEQPVEADKPVEEKPEGQERQTAAGPETTEPGGGEGAQERGRVEPSSTGVTSSEGEAEEEALVAPSRQELTRLEDF